MADVNKTIEIIFQGVDNVSGIISTIGNDFNSLSDSVEKIAQPFAAAADNVLKVDTALTALAVGGLALAYSKSTDFETAIVNLEKILGDEIGSIDNVKQAVFELSDQYGVSAVSITNSVTDFKKAGFDVQDALTLTEAGIGLVLGAAEAEFGVAESTEAIISVLKGFNAPAEEAGRLTDILNAVSNEYATTVSELSLGMAEIAPIASTMGFSFEETAGILTPIIEIFRSGGEAAVALKTGLLKLVDDSQPVQDALAAIGVSQKDANGELRSGKDILMDVAIAFQTADENDKLFLASQLVGIEQAARMVTVFDNLSKTTEITATALGAAGSVAEEVAKKLETSQVAVDRFSTAFENLAIKIGDEFRVAATSAVNGATDIENALSTAISEGSFDPIFDILESFSTSVGDYFTAVAEAIPEAMEQVNFDDFIESMENIADSVGGIFDGVDLTTPNGLAEAIQACIDTFTSLANVTAGMVDAFKPFIEGIAGYIKSFNEMDTASQESAGELLALSKAIVDLGAGIAAAILIIGDNADSLTTIFEIVVNTITGSFDAVVVVFDLLKLSVIEVLDGIYAAAEVFSNSFLFGAFSEDLEAQREVFAQWKTEIESDLYGAAESATEKLTGMQVDFRNLGESVENVPCETNINVIAETDTAKGQLETLGNYIEDMPAEVQTEILSVFESEGIDAAIQKIAELNPEEPTEKEIQIEVSATGKDAAEVEKMLSGESEWFEDEEIKKTIEIIQEGITAETAAEPFEIIEYYTEEKGWQEIKIPIEADLDESTVDETADDLEEKLDPLKVLELQVELDKAQIEKDIASIEASAETAQTAMEWEAKIEISSMETVQANLDALTGSIEATSAATADMYSSLIGGWDDLQMSDQWNFMDLLEDQVDMQQELVDAQVELTEAQAKYMEQKTQAMKDGDAAIQIDSSGLEPALELVMWEILEKVQIRATEEASEFLLGI